MSGTCVTSGGIASACGTDASVAESRCIVAVACGFVAIDTIGKNLTIIV